MSTKEDPLAATKSAKNLALGCVGCLGILVFVFLGIWIVVPETDPTSATESNNNAMAYIMCQQFTEKRLTSPGSADWPFAGARSTTTLPANRYRVQTHVDSQNTFGAMLRTQVDCIVRVEGQEWFLESIALE